MLVRHQGMGAVEPLLSPLYRKLTKLLLLFILITFFVFNSLLLQGTQRP